MVVHDKSILERFLRWDPILHMFGLGDLDDAYWPDTVWYGTEDDGRLSEVAMTFGDAPELIMMALTDGDISRMSELIRSLAHRLPRRMYVQFTPGLVEHIRDLYRATPAGKYLRMGLTAPAPPAADPEGLVGLGPADADEIVDFYAANYPGASFNKNVLASGQYLGVRTMDGLIGVAGVHVYSPTYGVAVLGGINVHREHRRQGIGLALTGALCRRLQRQVSHIGLLVEVENAVAIETYRKLGFVDHSNVDAFMLTQR